MGDTSMVELQFNMAYLAVYSEEEQASILRELWQKLGFRAKNKSVSQAFLNHTDAVNAVIGVCKTSKSSEVVFEALKIMVRLACDKDNANLLFSKHSELAPWAIDLVENGKTGEIKILALEFLVNMASHATVASAMFESHPKLVPWAIDLAENGQMNEVKSATLEFLAVLARNTTTALAMFASHVTALLHMILTRIKDEKTVFAAIALAYNLSCAPSNRNALRNHQPLVDALTEGRKQHGDVIGFYSLLALVNLFGAMEDVTSAAVLETDETMLIGMFNMLSHVMDKRELWTLNQSLLAFRYLCVVDKNRNLLWSMYESMFLIKVLTALGQAIDEKDTEAAENAVSTVSQFTSHGAALVWLKENKAAQLDKLFARLSNDPIFHDANKTAQFLFLILDPPPLVTSTSSSPHPTIMISYQWSYQAQARQIHQILIGMGCEVWRDEQNMKDNIVEAMADAVNRCSVVLVLVSRSYKESANCGMECQFAHNNKRKLIPVLVEPGYSFAGDGWLGLLLGTKLYYDVSKASGKEMEAVIQKLVAKELEGKNESVGEAPVAVVKKPVPQNEQEVRAWLSAVECGGEIADKLIVEGFNKADALAMLAKEVPSELKALVGVNGMQAVTLKAALKELF